MTASRLAIALKALVARYDAATLPPGEVSELVDTLDAILTVTTKPAIRPERPKRPVKIRRCKACNEVMELVYPFGNRTYCLKPECQKVKYQNKGRRYRKGVGVEFLRERWKTYSAGQRLKKDTKPKEPPKLIQRPCERCPTILTIKNGQNQLRFCQVCKILQRRESQSTWGRNNRETVRKKSKDSRLRVKQHKDKLLERHS